MGKIEKLTIKEVETFERLEQQLIQLQADFTTLSKKSPDVPINKFKLSVINEKLSTANKLLSDSYKPIKMFELFDDSDLPSNSDVVLVLAQYLEALELWRSSHIVLTERKWYWDLKEEIKIPASSPNSNYRASRA